MELAEIVSFLDEYLQIVNYQDVSNNGLQVEGRNKVERIAFAVDACMESFKGAIMADADMIVVHHGLIWGGIGYIRGIVKRRIEFLLKNNLSLYAAHLPLDAHREVGNNAMILRKIGAEPQEEFGGYKGVKIGYSAELNELTAVSEIAKKFDSAMLLPFGREKIKRVAAVSGKGCFALNEAIEKGVELFITGEPEHEAYHLAKEGGINVIFLGHYESEKFGVLSLMEVVKEKFGVDAVFLDIPTNF
uniref:Nif3-like dinuclear metal center hexameric protein n=1 Tax=Archaeoglobus fulgidus TaxID=2234 RepID=A0A7C3MFY3_ARCFL